MRRQHFFNKCKLPIDTNFCCSFDKFIGRTSSPRQVWAQFTSCSLNCNSKSRLKTSFFALYRRRVHWRSRFLPRNISWLIVWLRTLFCRVWSSFFFIRKLCSCLRLDWTLFSNLTIRRLIEHWAVWTSRAAIKIARNRREAQHCGGEKERKATKWLFTWESRARSRRREMELERFFDTERGRRRRKSARRLPQPVHFSSLGKSLWIGVCVSRTLTQDYYAIRGESPLIAGLESQADVMRISWWRLKIRFRRIIDAGCLLMCESTRPPRPIRTTAELELCANPKVRTLATFFVFIASNYRMQEARNINGRWRWTPHNLSKKKSCRTARDSRTKFMARQSRERNFSASEQ